MEKMIYVGNLPFSSSESEIHDLFSKHGTVYSVKMIHDRETGRPRGYGFVAMEEAAAIVAIQALDGQNFGGRSLRVNEARRKETTYQMDRRPSY
jgi:RNA recognition motif-containing protein